MFPFFFRTKIVNVYSEQAGQRTRDLPLGPRSQMGYKSWAPGYRGRLTVFTFIFDLWILVMFDPMKKMDSVRNSKFQLPKFFRRFI